MHIQRSRKNSTYIYVASSFTYAVCFCTKEMLDFLLCYTLLNTPSMNCQSSTHFTNSSYDAGRANASYLCISTNMRLGFTLLCWGHAKEYFSLYVMWQEKPKLGLIVNMFVCISRPIIQHSIFYLCYHSYFKP